MARVCAQHPFLRSENLCGRCGQEFCQECLVYPAGQPLPLCVPCAVIAAGARTGPKPLSKRRIKALARAREAELAAAAPAPLPDIANPVPEGFAFGETEAIAAPAVVLDDDEPRRGRRRNRDRAVERAAAAARDASIGPPEAVRDEMMSWLDSVYASPGGTDAPDAR